MVSRTVFLVRTLWLFMKGFDVYIVGTGYKPEYGMCPLRNGYLFKVHPQDFDKCDDAGVAQRRWRLGGHERKPPTSSCVSSRDHWTAWNSISRNVQALETTPTC